MELTFFFYLFFFLDVKAQQMLTPNLYVICLQGSQWQHLIAMAVFQLGDDSRYLYFFNNIQSYTPKVLEQQGQVLCFSGS